MLDKATILSKTQLRRELVNVPEWGGDVYVREMNGNERDEWEGSLLRERKKEKGRKKAEMEVVYKGARARLCAICMCDDQGSSMFTLADADDLGKLSATGLDRVYAAAMEINGLREEDVDELVGKSETTSDSESGSGSPSASEPQSGG